MKGLVTGHMGTSVSTNLWAENDLKRSQGLTSSASEQVVDQLWARSDRPVWRTGRQGTAHLSASNDRFLARAIDFGDRPKAVHHD